MPDQGEGHEFVSALRDLMRIFETDYRGMIIGGMAVIALGYPRATTDIDATVIEELGNLENLLSRLESHGIVPRMKNVIDFARANHVLLMRHKQSGIDIDISIALLPFEEEAISNCQGVDFAGIKIFIPRAEDLIIYKMVASRPEDLRDVEELLLRHLDKINLKRVRSIVSQFADVLDRPEMVTQLDILIERSRQ